jgi:peptidoglycan hydrolase CwlO-like protein
MSNISVIILSLLSAFISGLGVSVFSIIGDRKKEKIRRAERDQDLLKLELKDLQIKLYQLEKDLDEWKEKYYNTIQELVSVRAELEETMIRLSLIHIEHEE